MAARIAPSVRRAVTLAIMVATPSLAAAFATDLPLPPYEGAAAHGCAALLLARRGSGTTRFRTCPNVATIVFARADEVIE